MKRRDFISLSGAGALSAGWSSSGTWAKAARRDLGEDSGQEDPRFREISGLIEAEMAAYRVPGVAFGLAKNGMLAMRGFGLTNLDNPQPVTTDTVFPIMSITKTVVAVAVLRLVEQGRVALDAPIREYLSDFRVQDDEATRTVTLRHLLTHTPGWEGQLNASDRGAQTLATFAAGMAENPQLARPGELWSYNNAGFDVAARILEVVTGSGIHAALRDLVFNPLGLERAFTETGFATTYRFAAPHVERGDRTVVSRPFNLPAGTGSGGAAMSVASLMTYAQWHIGESAAPGGEPVLSASSLALMRAPQAVKRPTTDEMGVGWHLRRLNGVWTAAQCGTGGGHCLHLQVVPERGLAFALLTNHNIGWRLNTVVERAILHLYEGLALEPGQATGGNRGGNEDMTTHAKALSQQPSHAEYVGSYQRMPSAGHELISRGGQLMLSDSAGERPLVFWGPDLTYQDTDDPTTRGIPVEFIRDASGEVRWVRRNGRIALKV